VALRAEIRTPFKQEVDDVIIEREQCKAPSILGFE